MKDLIDSLNQSRYKEMILLVDFYTDFVLLTDGDEFGAGMKSKRLLLKKNIQRLNELDSTEKASKIDFDYDLFIRNQCFACEVCLVENV